MVKKVISLFLISFLLLFILHFCYLNPKPFLFCSLHFLEPLTSFLLFFEALLFSSFSLL